MPDSFDYTRKPVLVLGASGFIGSRVCIALAANPAFQPIAASRHAGNDGLTLDAGDPAAMRVAMRDVAYVVNCVAGDAKSMTRAAHVLFDSARLTPPRRIVHLSSMAVYGAATGLVQEEQAPVAPLSAYGAAKLECDALATAYGRDGGDAVILRPTCVFGPGSPQWTTRIARLLQARRLGDLGPAGDGFCNLAYIEDVVAAIVHALEAPCVGNQIFNVSSSNELRWNDFLIRFARALDATPVRRLGQRSLSIETKIMAPLCKATGKIFRASATEAVTPALAALFRQDIRVDSSAAVAALSMPQTPVNDMIAATVHSMRGPGTQPATGARATKAPAV